MRHRLTLSALAPIAALLFTACAIPQSVNKGAATSKPVSPYQRQFAEDAPSACAAANRALLGDGYLTEPIANDKLKGRKSYRIDSEHTAVVDMTVTCLANPDGGSSVFANGLRTIYEGS